MKRKRMWNLKLLSVVGVGASVTLGILLLLLTTEAVFPTPAPAARARVRSTITYPLIINHNHVNAAAIPLTSLDAARVLDSFFTHKSIGGNIIDGLLDLQTLDPARYSIDVTYGTADGTGITHYQVGSNGDPQSKIDGFDTVVRAGPSRDTAFMKLCVGDFPPWTSADPETVWNSYRSMMESLQAAMPDTIFVWWTLPLTTQEDDRGNAEKAVFNALVRQYVQENGGVLFDIADIESHDPDGNPIIGPAGYEAMYNDYSSDGAHLSAAGQQRLAQAVWWLLAQIADSSSATWISLYTPHATQSSAPGETAVYTLAVDASPGFNDPVSLTIDALPPAAGSTFSPNPVVPPADARLYLTPTLSTEPDTYVMTVSGTSGELTATATLTLTVTAAPGFTLNISPAGQEAAPGETVHYTVTIQGFNGFSEPVTLTITGLPDGVLANWGENPVTPDAQIILLLILSDVPAFGYHALLLSGKAKSLEKSVPFSLTIPYPVRLYLPVVLRMED